MRALRVPKWKEEQGMNSEDRERAGSLPWGVRQEQQLGVQRITSSCSRAGRGWGRWSRAHHESVPGNRAVLLPGASVGRNWALFIIHGQAGCIQSLNLFSKLLFLLELVGCSLADN